MNIIEVLSAIIFLIAIAEIIISGSWQSFYFEFGIPLYRKSALLPFPPNLSPEELSVHFKKGTFVPILFKQISPHQVAFREAFFSFRLTYTPVMHGVIQYKQGEIQVIGLANWFALAFIAFFIAMGSSFGDIWEFELMFTIFPIVLFASLYFIQVKRFNNVYDIILSQREHIIKS